MTENEMQACLTAGELGGTPSEVRAIELAFSLGRIRGVAEALAEVDSLASDFSAYDAANELRHMYEELAHAEKK